MNQRTIMKGLMTVATVGIVLFVINSVPALRKLTRQA